MPIRSQAALPCIVVLAALLGGAAGQQTKIATEWEVAQLAFDVSTSGIVFDQSNVNIASGPKLKFKRERRNSKLAKWSPDGGKLAFLTVCQEADVKTPGLPTDMTPTLHCLDVANADGSHSRRLTSYPKRFKDTLSVADFAWSPSGEEIAYIEVSDRGWMSVSVVRPDGSGRKEIQRLKCLLFFGTALDWSPDGQKLALTGCSGDKPTVLVVDRITGSAFNVPDGRDPVWSPDGKMLLFRKTANPNNEVVSLSVVNADGTGERKVLNGEQAEFGLAWHPSGRSIAFGSTRDKGTVSEIFTVDLDGTNLQKIASSQQRDLSYASPIFSPDARELVVVADSSLNDLRYATFLPTLRGIGHRHSILLINLATGDKQRLAEGCYPNLVWRRK